MFLATRQLNQLYIRSGGGDVVGSGKRIGSPQRGMFFETVSTSQGSAESAKERRHRRNVAPVSRTGKFISVHDHADCRTAGGGRMVGTERTIPDSHYGARPTSVAFHGNAFIGPLEFGERRISGRKPLPCGAALDGRLPCAHASPAGDASCLMGR